MTTKQQEREALQKIRKIVEALGEHSYIGTAFEGVFEIAEENIEYDFGCSLKQQVESLEEQDRANKETIEKLRKENVLLAGRLHGCVEEHKREVTELREELDEHAKEYQASAEEIRLNFNNTLEALLKGKDNEIMKLKARLYDLMTKEEA